MREKDDLEKYTALGRKIQMARISKGLSKQEHADLSGVSRSAIHDVCTGRVGESKKIPKIIEPLGLTMSQLYDESPGQISEQYPEYSLDTAPVCETPYCLKLDSGSQLFIKGLDLAPLTVIVVPWNPEASRNALLAVYRRHGHQRASIARTVAVGDERLLTSNPSAQVVPLEESLRDGEDGQVLGAIDDLASLSHLFYRVQ